MSELNDWLNEAIEEYKADKPSTEFGYDATETTKRRKAPTRVIKSEDEHLKRNSRKILTSTTRDARRNFITPRWAISKHIDFVVDMNFLPCTGDEELDKRLAEFVTMASKAKNFDISGRHGLSRYLRIAESARIVDGDFMSIRLRGGYLQAIESDRVRNPDEATKGGLVHTDGEELDNWVHGVKINRYGKPLSYAVHSRTKNGFVYEGTVGATKVIPLGFYDRFDQVRGISPLASAINYLKDLHESYDYALAKAKMAQLFALKITREADFGMGTEFDDGDVGDDKTINFGTDPQILDLNTGEDAAFLSNNTPESDTQAFWQDMTQLVLKSLNIPYSFWAEDHTNFFGSRAALILYLRSVEKWREDIVDFRNDWLTWRLKVGMLKGEIELPRDFEIDPKNWKWIPTGLEWWNPAQEIAADVDAVNNAMKSRTEIRLERRGDDWKTAVADILAEEQAYLKKLGVITEQSIKADKAEAPEQPIESEDSQDEQQSN